MSTAKHLRFLEFARHTENESRMVSLEELKERDLSFGNGGSWGRMDSSFAKGFRYVTRKGNGVLNYSWDASDEDKTRVEEDFRLIEKKKSIAISHIKVYGAKDAIELGSKRIRADIKAHFKEQKCVVCGNKSTEVDHKNGLYNNPRVLQAKSQYISDFQPLCRHCNQQKRTSILYTKKTGKRYKATDIPQLAVLGVAFTKGDESYVKGDPDAMVGTYWYDPIAFMAYTKKPRYVAVIDEDGEDEWVCQK